MTRTIAILVSLALVGCAQDRVIDGYCVYAKPISYSASGDTADTKSQIKEHNAVYAKLCP